MAKERTLRFDPSVRAESKIDRQRFGFSHGLAGNPLFSLSRLLELARSASRRNGDLYFDTGEVRVEQKWGEIPPPEITYIQAFKRIETAGAWIILKHVEKEPEYAELLAQCTLEVRNAASAELADLIERPEMIILVSSPHRVTPFHIDAELNFLLQVMGEKTIRIFDRDDRAVLTEEELEDFYSLPDYRVTYKPGTDDRALCMELRPGLGVHVPVCCPHWVKNGAEPSVSVSVNFELPDAYRAEGYRSRRKVRLAAAPPAPAPGETSWHRAAWAKLWRMVGR